MLVMIPFIKYGRINSVNAEPRSTESWTREVSTLFILCTASVIQEKSINISQRTENKKNLLSSIVYCDHVTEKEEEADDSRQASTNHVSAPCLRGQ